jgi:hypothetical protein
MKNDVLDLTLKLCDILKHQYDSRNTSHLVTRLYSIEPGNKYLKIVMSDGDKTNHSVHAFVDKKTGDLYKPATWRAPAKGIRFNLFNDMKKLESIADWAGGYLYVR